MTINDIKKMQFVNWEGSVIRRGFVAWWNCKTCEELGWKAECKSKEDCGELLYDKLKNHFDTVLFCERQPRYQ